MEYPPLTIRNLTTSLLELRVLERFESAKVCCSRGGGALACITRCLSGLGSHNSGPSSSQIALKSETFSSHHVSIPIAPFESRTTDIRPSANQVLQLTFEVEGQKYRVGLPTPAKHSTVLTPLSPNPLFEFTAVYLPSSTYLALYSSAKLESWMGNLKSELPLSALSIPGTHNSATHHKALPSVRCQAASIKDQLNNGVRFLDIRVQPESSNDVSKDGLILCHSAFPVSLTGPKYFRDLVNTVFSFLNDNPTETVIMSVKREGIGRATDQHLSKILRKHYANDTNRWFTENRIPTLGDARSKIVLLRRFCIDDSLKKENSGQGWAVDGESWPDNCADGLCSSGEIRVQDFYQVTESMNIRKKIGFSTDHLVRSSQAVFNTPGDIEAAAVEAIKWPIFINFLSASNFWRSNCWPDRIAAKVNPSIIDFLCRRHNEPKHIQNPDGNEERKIGDGSTGVVVCDWVGIDGDWDLVRCVVGMNSKLELLN
ncbi:hypothetical protein G7Y89_g4309 [Cudoniella acicularis]|uniref:Phosphatidylinositol-specific phospholipase C X domain-containing protein n=1 Tax=Cudoniella acicularis TaxID=354080 RepID=A0A8H4W6U6_9HELO|nr:hypothetical protein G7Y89_g4309 [Cudoniella acicularis]